MNARSVCRFALILMILAAGWPAAGPARAAPPPELPETLFHTSHALLIGIDRYANLPAGLQLEYAVSDVIALKEILVRRYGFPRANVTTLTDGNATRANIEKALADLADTRRVQPTDRILIYYSGHGQTVKLPTGTEMGFLIPSDATVDLSNSENAGPYLGTCLRMDTIWGYLESSPARQALILADACYSGLLTKSRGARRKLSPHDLAGIRSMQVITAGDRGQKTVEDSSWGHGAFTYKLLEELRARAAVAGTVFTAGDLHEALGRSVSALTNSRQTPLIGSYKSDEGDFLFIATGAPAARRGKAVVTIDTIPHGASIFVDGVESKGETTPADIELDMNGEKMRRIEIATELPGYKSVVRTLTISSGRETLAPTITLERSEPPAPTATSTEADFIPLYTGSAAQLGDWMAAHAPGVTQGGFFREADGSLRSVGGMGTYFYTKRAFGDFVLRLDWNAQTASMNSGVYVRWPQPRLGASDPIGHEVQILDEWNDPKKRTGAVWNYAAPTRFVAVAGRWNSMEIRIIGTHYSVRINGQPVCECDSSRTLSGYVGIQYGGPTDTVWFRNIRIKPLGGR